jgi:hypothetical protein
MAMAKRSRRPPAKAADAAIVQTIREEAEAFFTHMVDSFIRGYRRRLSRDDLRATPKRKRGVSVKSASKRQSARALSKAKRRSAPIAISKARTRKAK